MQKKASVSRSSIPRSIARTLLTSVLTVYFLLTLIITTGQIAFEYNNTREALLHDLRNQHHTFAASLARAMWEFNQEQTNALAAGLINIPAISGIIIRDDQERVLINQGETMSVDRLALIDDSGPIPEHSGVFGYYSPLVFEFAGGSELVGDVVLFSSRDITIDRLKPSLILLLVGALLKSSILILLFTLAFRHYLREPLENLIEQLRNFSPEHPESSQIRLKQEEVNEFSLLEDAYNDLLSRLRAHQTDLTSAQQEVNDVNRRLEDQNLLLEQEIAEKTLGISNLMLDLERRRHELEMRQQSLEQEVHQRRITESRLKQTNQELEESLEFLQQIRLQLMSSEKMAALGNMVANITHDVSTPLGVSVTATSYLQERLQKIQQQMAAGTASEQDIKDFMDTVTESNALIESNLHRANEIISGFKQVAVDQAADHTRSIHICNYVQRIIQSLQPQLRRKSCVVQLNCPDDIEVRCNAGALAQVITNMMMNSILHAFPDNPNGRIDIDVSVVSDHLHIRYRDNGVGMTSHQLRQLFEPFYTTSADNGGSGLGAHIIYTLITQTLAGNVEVSSQPDAGLCYDFQFPVEPMNVSINTTS
ncbi:sensor histidine kinase [Aliidiomarina indica]|uniref:sensor histidine kinase n=1 Tax=Aliidiomarina indica TaxID=2749147 RepID=UPI00188F93A6|nr:HAMP domain-containing sensor histidine kinase [Aliidiomarina indica]